MVRFLAVRGYPPLWNASQALLGNPGEESFAPLDVRGVVREQFPLMDFSGRGAEEMK
jgi:hypothetical protein